jgi:hypothetical protein
MIDLDATFLKISGHNKGTKGNGNGTWEYYDCMVIDESSKIHRIRTFIPTHRKAILKLDNGDKVSFTDLELKVYKGNEYYQTTNVSLIKKTNNKAIEDKLDKIIRYLGIIIGFLKRGDIDE